MARDLALLEALGAGRAHVVLVERVEHARAGHAGDDGHRVERERERRQDDVLHDVAERLEVTREQGVDDVEPRPAHGLEQRVHASPGRQDVPDAREEDDEEDARPVDGHRHAEKREDGRHAVDRGPLVDGGDDAEDDAHERREDDRHEGELDRRREAAHDLLGDRRVRVVGGPQVTGERTTQEVEVLQQYRVAQAVRVAPCLHGLFRGMLAEHDGRGVRREDPHDEEDDDGHAEQHEYRLENALDDVLRHWPRPPFGFRGDRTSRRRSGRESRPDRSTAERSEAYCSFVAPQSHTTPVG